MTVLFILSAAASEEFLFRGTLFSLFRGLSAAGRILISAAVFSAAHLFNVDSAGPALTALQMAYAFAAGAVLAFLYEKTGKLWILVLIHAVLNISVCFCCGGTAAKTFTLYIDPGTGSMLFTVLIGVISAAVYSVRVFAMKAKVKFGARGKTDEDREDIVVFSDNKRYWTVFEPVLKELGRRGYGALYLTASEDDPALSSRPENVRAEYIGSVNKMYGRLNNLNARIVLSTTPGLEVYQWKRAPKAAWYVHIPHAASEIVLYRMFGLDYYDAVLLSGKYQEEGIRELEALRSLSAKDISIVGIPYMDTMAERLSKVGPAPAHERTVLLAPSWGKSALFGVYGGSIIDVLLKTGYHVIVRPHPQSFQSEKELMDELMSKYPESAQLEWNRDTDNFEVLRRSDILVSDFSGVVFEFSLIYDKPVIYTDPDIDLSPYDAWWLKKPLWTASALPRLGVRLTEENMQDLKSLIDDCLTDPRFAAGRAEVRSETWEHKGEGAVRAADYLVNKLEELKKEEQQ
ncbi:MAG: CPBP family intramembrane metalloprotease [Clostridia bacterium]|nr:CPBP family intramembrane metalloprotease [Clostridia bacterium]